MLFKFFWTFLIFNGAYGQGMLTAHERSIENDPGRPTVSKWYMFENQGSNTCSRCTDDCGSLAEACLKRACGYACKGKIVDDKFAFALRGKVGGERVRISCAASGFSETYTMTTSARQFQLPLSCTEFKIDFLNDGGDRDIRFDAYGLEKSITHSMFSGWRCGSSNENSRCDKVRQGWFYWGGEYVVSIPSITLDSNDCVAVKVITAPDDYPGEMSWDMGHSCSVAVDTLTARDVRHCCFPPGATLTLTCRDDYDDGWSGGKQGYLEIGGVRYCNDFTDGSSTTRTYAVPQVTSSNRATCQKGEVFCTHRHAKYEFKDCDGDGIPDHTCSDRWGNFGVMQSSKNCADSWPSGHCESASSQAFLALSHYDNWLVKVLAFIGILASCTAFYRVAKAPSIYATVDGEAEI